MTEMLVTLDFSHYVALIIYIYYDWFIIVFAFSSWCLTLSQVQIWLHFTAAM